MPEIFGREQDVITVILGGGRGNRLDPLTRERAKPAVPIAGKYRLIDIPISNCIHSGMERMMDKHFHRRNPTGRPSWGGPQAGDGRPTA